jgi:hypothetical protein
LLLLAASPLTVICEEPKLTVICTTSVLGSIVKDLAGERVKVIIMASTSACPAYYDVSPSDVEAVQKASLILYHGMEAWLEKLVETSGTNATLVKVPGTWNTPEGAIDYYERVAEILEEHLGIDTSERLEKCVESITSTAESLKKEAEARRVGDVKVICMIWQKPFVSWLGFDIIAEFAPPEKLSSSDVAGLVEVGQSEGAMLVISNLQSGIAHGKYVADNIGAVHVALTNFPDPEKGLLNLSHMFVHNAETLFNAMEEYETKAEMRNLQRSLHMYRVLSYSLAAIAVAEAAILTYLLAVRRK